MERGEIRVGMRKGTSSGFFSKISPRFLLAWSVSQLNIDIAIYYIYLGINEEQKDYERGLGGKGGHGMMTVDSDAPRRGKDLHLGRVRSDENKKFKIKINIFSN